jgi:hypothetical protein
MLPSLWCDLGEHICRRESVRKKLVEQGVQFPTRETLCLSRCHLHLRFPSSGVRTQHRTCRTGPRTALHGVSAVGSREHPITPTSPGGLHRRSWQLCSADHTSPRCEHVAHFERSKLAQDRAANTSRDGPRSDIVPPHIDTRGSTAEPRRERPRGRARGRTRARGPGSFTSRFRSSAVGTAVHGAAETAAHPIARLIA